MITYFVKLEPLENVNYKGQTIYKILEAVCTDSEPTSDLKEFQKINALAGDIIIGRMKCPGFLTYLVARQVSTAGGNSVYWFPENFKVPEQIIKEIAHQDAIRNMSEMFGNNNNLLIFNMFRYLCLLSKFAEYGIFINDRNREEQYIEIINKENPELINHLQEYLDLRDYVEGAMLHYDEFAKALTTAEF